MAGLTLDQIYIANPITTNQSSDLMYFARNPYTPGNDAAMTYSNFAAQFGTPYTASALTQVNDTNVTLTLGGTPATALLQAVSITAGWTGQLGLSRGGTNANLTASNGGVVYSTASALAILAGTATANLPLLSGSSAAPAWGAFALNLGGALTTAGAVTYSGAFGVTFTFTNTTSVTFPTSGTLATTSQIPTGAALTETNDTNVTLTLGGSAATALVNAASITAGWAGTLSLARGGLAAALTASNGGIFYSTGSAGAILSGTATANQVLLSGSSTTPAWSTATYPATTTINQLLYSSSANTIAGLATVNSASLTTTSGGVPQWLAMTDGQLIIGSSAGAPVAATISAGTGISIANGHNSITISVNGGGNWVDETGSSVTMATNTGYTSDDGASLVTFTLPTSSAIGDFVEINGKGSGLWKIAQAAGQQIQISGGTATTLGAGGSLASVNQYDCVRLRCLTANTIWTVVSQQSTGLTVV